MSVLLHCLSLLFAIAGLNQYFRLAGWEFHGVFLVFQLVPALVFGITGIVYSEVKSKVLLMLAFPLCALTLYVWLMGNFLLDPAAHGTQEFSCDEVKYRQIMERVYGNKDGDYGHFPAKFPVGARDARIYDDQHPTRGGIALQFQCSISPEETQRLTEYYKKSSYQNPDRHIYSGSPVFHTKKNDEEFTPGKFVHYFLTEKPRVDSDSGVSIDPVNNIVIYWMKSP